MISWETIKSQFNLPNSMSLARAFVGLILPLFILSEGFFTHGLALALFIVGALTDYWDGQLARRMNLVSDTGKLLDPFADKVFILGCFAAFMFRGYFSLFWIFLIFAREIIVTFCRFAWLHEGRAIGAEKLGKVKFAMQVFTVSVSFTALMLEGGPAGDWLVGASGVLMILTSLLTVISGVTFLYSNRIHMQTKEFAKFTAALGVGLLPKAPGTWGTILGISLLILASVNAWVYAVTFMILFLSGWWAADRLKIHGRNDPSFMVTDEACGIFLTLMLIPLNPWSILTGFLLFRLLDIFKPFPINQFEKLPGFWGIMTDDLAAGLLGWVVMYLVFA